MKKNLQNLKAEEINEQQAGKLTGGGLDRNYLRSGRRKKTEPTNPSKGGTLTKRPIPNL